MLFCIKYTLKKFHGIAVEKIVIPQKAVPSDALHRISNNLVTHANMVKFKQNFIYF